MLKMYYKVIFGENNNIMLYQELINMATKSFLKNIVIKDKKSALAFLSALENSEGKKKKDVGLDKSVETIKDAETIKKIFKRKQKWDIK